MMPAPLTQAVLFRNLVEVKLIAALTVDDDGHGVQGGGERIRRAMGIFVRVVQEAQQIKSPEDGTHAMIRPWAIVRTPKLLT